MTPFPVAPGIHLAGWVHVLYFGVLLPMQVIRATFKIKGSTPVELPDRVANFQARSLMLLLFGVLSVLIAAKERIRLFPRAGPPAVAWLAGLAVLAAMVAFMRPRWRRAVAKKAPAVHFFMPSNRAERAWWTVVAVLAGVSEEITWRGVQTALLQAATGNAWLAAAASGVSFAAAHYSQGKRSLPIFVAFAVSFQALVWLASSLYVAMAVHVAYDLAAGFSYGKLGREQAEADARSAFPAVLS